jgi:hypothetical protein
LRLFAALALLAVSNNARADEFYYVLVFGSQQVPARATFSHSFAIFVKATGHGPCAESYQLEAHTISWAPQSLNVRIGALLPECGQNLDINRTMQWALCTGQRISEWGPYQICKELYDRALAQISLLESGCVRYKAVDSGFPTDFASNCIHAISSVADGHRLRVLSPSFGETASYYVTRRFEPWIIDPCQKHDWVFQRLGLEAYPVIHRELENPQSGVFLGAINALLGRDPVAATTCCSPGVGR